jgi:hypothetical protein
MDAHLRTVPTAPWRRALVALAALVAVAAPAAAQLSGAGAQSFTEDDIGIYGPQTNDELGWTFATGDFDGDGADDLATGVYLDDNATGSYVNAGLVILRYGILGQGLATNVSFDLLSQFNGGSPDPVEAGDLFGWALAAGDFNGDGWDDLAVGGIGDGPDNGGAVQVHYGGSGGLDLSGAQHRHQDSPGIADDAEDNDLFGYALAAGDFNGDGFADLAIGVPGEDTTVPPGFFIADHGVVHTLYGSAPGLTTAGSQYFHQDVAGMADQREASDRFGEALAAGDFNGDGFADLAIGVRGEDSSAGGVAVLLGGASGLTVTGNAFWTQDSAGVPDAEEDEDFFGDELAAGDFDHDGFADLAIGIPWEDVDTPGGEIPEAGAVQVLRGGASGLTASGGSFWTQDPLPGEVAIALFGYAVAAGDFAQDGWDDLAIGASLANVGHGPWEGAVITVLGEAAAGGLTAVGAGFWRQGVDGLPGIGEQGDRFGSGLATGDFDGNGAADLVIGAPRESTVAVGDGAEWVVYGESSSPVLFSDGFETGTTGAWSDTVP